MIAVCRYIKDTLIRMTRMVDKLSVPNMVIRYRKDTGYRESLSTGLTLVRLPEDF
jgi:hypothetical protein